MAANAKSIEAAHASIRALIAEKLKYLVPMTIIFMVGYIGLTVLAAFGKGIMGIKVTGAFNLGYLLIAINYVLSWMLAIVYVRIAPTMCSIRWRPRLPLTSPAREPRDEYDTFDFHRHSSDHARHHLLGRQAHAHDE